MNTKFKRPLPKEKDSISLKEHFELRYLRWDYMVRAENPTKEDLLKYEKTIKYMSHKLYNKYKYDFSFHGLQIEDLENVARCYAVSYLGLYSFKKNPEKLERFNKSSLKKYGVLPDESVLEKKEVCDLMSFIEHRIQDFAHYTRNKYSNSPGFSSQRIYVQVIPGSWPTDEELVQDPSKYGWKIVSRPEYVKLDNLIKGLPPGTSMLLNDKVYRVAAPQNEWKDLFFSSSLEQDIENTAEDPDSNTQRSTRSPEDIMIDAEERRVKIRSINGITVELSAIDRIQRVLDRYENFDLNRKKKFMTKIMNHFKNKKDRPNYDAARRIVNSIKKKAERTANGSVRD